MYEIDDRWGARHDAEVEAIEQDQLKILEVEHLEPDHLCEKDECPFWRPNE